MPKISTSKSKNKASSNTTSSSSSNTVSSSSDDRNKDGSPKRSEDATYKAYSRAKENIRYAKSTTESIEWRQNPEKAHKDAAKYLERAKESLDFLNQQETEKNQAYLKQFNSDYTALNQKCSNDAEKYHKVAKHQENLEAYHTWISFGAKTTKEERTYKAYYKNRDAFKAEYPKEFEGSYNQKMVSAVDEFFKVEVYKRLENLEGKVASIIKNMYKKNGEREAYILSAPSYLKDFDKPLKSLAYYKKDLLEDHTAANALETQINKEKSMLEEYINSGKFAANRAEYEQGIIDAVRLGKKAMSNSTYEKLASDHSFDDGGKIIRVVITSSDWGIKKNSFDIPKYKYLSMSVAVKKEGKCYEADGYLRRDYEGGSSYAKPRFVYTGINDEMNCNNVNK
ncbi:hypothetical protein [Aureispira anguillae]|nr:hypothetical protein [Aureispira anguillae]